MNSDSGVTTQLVLAGCLALSSAQTQADKRVEKPSVSIPPLVYKLEQDLNSVLFPEISPYEEGTLQVSPTHRIWYAQYGNPKGVPVVVLHGGPGFGCSPRDMRFFDPQFYRIILLDQRGAGRSTPHASLEENNTQKLVADIEALRAHLQVTQWVIFGGSWGSALALTYAQAHPERCLGFVLRGIFLGTKAEVLQLWYGMKDTFPEVWDEFNAFIPPNEQADLISAFHKRLNDPDPKVHMPAALAFAKYDFTAAFALTAPLIDAMLRDEKMVLGVARIFTHFTTHDFFLEPDQIVRNLKKINHLPLFIVHGRFDTICRAKVAYELAKNWPGSKLSFIQDAGHSAAEPGIAKALVEATQKMKELVK